MRRAALALLLLLGACAVTPQPDTAVVAGNINTMNPILEPSYALNYASWAMAVPSRVRNNATAGAYVMAAVDYLAGYVATSPRFDGINGFAVQRLLVGRQEERRALGVAPGATSTEVVNDLLGVYKALLRHDVPAAEASLPTSVFTLGPQRTLAILADLPPMPAASSALSAIAAQYNGNSRFCPLCL